MAKRMGLLGKKVGMTQSYDEKGNWRSMCVLEMGPCVVLNIKTPERDGYAAIQLGFGEQKPHRVAKPAMGLFNKVKTAPSRFIKEVRLTPEELTQFQVGQTLSVDQVFSVGDVVDVHGIGKGKGFQGVMKRHHFSGFRATHGTHEYFRHGGSIGCRLTPGRTFKGMKMPGQMGNKPVTVQNLRVLEVLPEQNLLLLNGAVPGAPEGFLTVHMAIKRPFLPFSVKAEAAAPAAA